MKDLKHYMVLAEVFRYPTPERSACVDEWLKIVKTAVPELMPKFDSFVEHIQQKTIAGQQEYYIATFDVQALCYLDIGYVLYGEDYNRGVFLANMKKEQEMAGNNCGSELPDHLPNILTLLPKLRDENLAEELIVSMMVPALENMIESFQSAGNVYKGMLEILLRIMERDFLDSKFERFSFTSQGKAKSFECLPQWRNIK